MKNVLIYPLVFISLFLINIQVKAGERRILLNDVNTLNIKDKLDVDIREVKQICSYEYCGYISSNDIDGSIDSFTDNYIKEKGMSSEDVMVKGIKITKIVIK